MTKIDLFRPFLLFTAIVIFSAAFVSVGLRNYTPQDFAEAGTITAQQQAEVDHAKAMYALTEQDTANAITNQITRRGYGTVAIMVVMASIAGLVGLTAGVGGAVVGTKGLEFALANLARGKVLYREISTRPQVDYLPDGRGVFTTRGGRLLLLDETGRVEPLEAGAVANPARLDLLIAQLQAHVAIEQSKHQKSIEVIK